jgi:hypothetical protein
MPAQSPVQFGKPPAQPSAAQAQQSQPPTPQESPPQETHRLSLYGFKAPQSLINAALGITHGHDNAV